MFRAYTERLAAYAYSIVTSRETAEEIVQDVFLAIWQRREQWLVRGTLKQYLYGSVRNGALNALKRRRRGGGLWSRAVTSSEPPAMSVAEPQPGAALRAPRAHVRAALSLYQNSSAPSSDFVGWTD